MTPPPPKTRLNGGGGARFGAIDGSNEKGIAILAARVCTQADAGPVVTCAGTTADGREIAVTSSVAPDAQLVITVGDANIFSGALSTVLDEAARG